MADSNTAFLRKLIEDVSDANVTLLTALAEANQEIVRLKLRVSELTDMVDENTIEEFVAKHDTDIERYITPG